MSCGADERSHRDVAMNRKPPPSWMMKVLMVFMARHRRTLAILFVLLHTGFQLCGAFASRTLDPASPDAAVELNANTFNSTLLAAPARWAIVEFYAHWCPACRNYKPQFERIARLFNGQNAIHPGIVYMAKVDCALKVNTALCERFNIGHYPTLLWGPPSKFAWNAAKSDVHTGWEVIENARKAELLLQYINDKIGKAYTLEDAVSTENQLMQGDELDLRQVAISNYDIEEATAKAMDIILVEKLLNQKTRPSFIQFLQVLVVHHPSRNCRKGTAELLMNLEDFWPSLPKQGNGELQSVDSEFGIQKLDYKVLEQFHICGEHIPRGYWMFCRGSRNDTRGYSCGLWLLFHALSVRVEDRLASSMLRTICNFVTDFFNCKECRDHFLEFCSSAKAKVSSRREFVLWLWDVHNEVNERVGLEETASDTADPKFHKIAWPPVHLCKLCWVAHDPKQGGKGNTSQGKAFSRSDVYSFLMKFYGHALAPSNDSINHSLVRRNPVVLSETQDSTRSAVTVPIGAALAIAFASCGFGGVACVWRMQQKRRKQIRRRV